MRVRGKYRGAMLIGPGASSGPVLDNRVEVMCPWDRARVGAVFYEGPIDDTEAGCDRCGRIFVIDGEWLTNQVRAAIDGGHGSVVIRKAFVR